MRRTMSTAGSVLTPVGDACGRVRRRPAPSTELRLSWLDASATLLLCGKLPGDRGVRGALLPRPTGLRVMKTSLGQVARLTNQGIQQLKKPY